MSEESVQTVHNPKCTQFTVLEMSESLQIAYFCGECPLAACDNMKDSNHFDNYNFPFLYLRKLRVLFVHWV